MHEEIGVYDAKTRLPEILRRVEAGETFTITDRGKAIADLTANTVSREKARQAVANLLKAQKKQLTDSELKELIEAGRQRPVS